MMMTYPEKINDSLKFLRERGINKVDTAIVLGTGLGKSFVDSMKVQLSIPYEDIPHFPEATVEFHHGKLIYGTIGEKYVLAFNGRFHLYEGYDFHDGRWR